MSEPASAPNFAENFGAAVKQGRTDKGISQLALAGLMQAKGFDFHQQTVYSIERAGRAVSFEEAHALGEILGFSPELLLVAEKTSAGSAGDKAEAHALFYTRELALAHRYLQLARDLRRMYLNTLGDAEKAGFVPPTGLQALADWQGLQAYLDSFRDLERGKASWWLSQGFELAEGRAEELSQKLISAKYDGD